MSSRRRTSSLTVAGLIRLVGRGILALGLSRDLLGRRTLRRLTLDHGHRGVVTLTRLDLDDADVSTVAVAVKRPDLLEQGVHHVLVADLLENLSTVVQRALFRVRDQLLRIRPQRTSLRLRRSDPA